MNASADVMKTKCCQSEAIHGRMMLRHLASSERPRQNGRHFADDLFKRNIVNANVEISMKV